MANLYVDALKTGSKKVLESELLTLIHYPYEEINKLRNDLCEQIDELFNNKDNLKLGYQKLSDMVSDIINDGIVKFEKEHSNQGEGTINEVPTEQKLPD